MNQQVLWGDAPLCWQEVVQVARGQAQLALSAGAWERIAQGRAIVQHIIDAGQIAYGINTGLGALCNITLPEEQLSQLSRNTLLSHACGVGPLLDDAQTRAIMCAAVANYSHGKSGISCAIVQQLLAFLNQQITPQVPSQGSVGYLTHMAHIGLALMGSGEVSWQGRVVPAAEALAQAGLSAISPGAKEGLSLVNGTPCMTGMACLALDDASQLLDWADVTGAMSFEALRGQIVAFDAEILALKASPGMQHSGARLRQLLADSPLLSASQGIRTQDALSLRSMPQVHGACRDQFDHAERQINTELNACTDNPLILGTLENWRVVSQAHPHGESVAMACDVLAIAMAELGAIAERRLDRLVNPLISGLPAFLVAKPGVNSGMMIAQYVAASLCAENKQLAQPAVLDNFVTSALQEDHLSLGTGASLKLQRLLANLYQIMAIEYLLAAQGLEFHAQDMLAAGTRHALALLRQRVATWEDDRWLAPEIAKAVATIKSHRADWMASRLNGQ
ncbi:TPA: histidine ammonia-lyase [Raoultella ornithinolytica]|uniref:HAL/PAL/TAL family ammonia-lyase n=1 Tax=Raoultella ornithinolytica TaxID=54291 RepID=UPI000B4DEDB0|nr:histidine ammonia-lyase [Raoultella ornithinolytica]MEB7942052.1 histidine ammonia-lyase [Raoultella ornithinolytica]OWP39660.1 histidine ammonia-lyase [Raoultella ornithinolytica]HDQ5284879.1 histidine ammonia-lyase [Raoultella ornithinolytica]HEC2567072.1 histidine ammonia-lyase [Raoultella ornithinolytica]HEC2634525.1 histidine ammonia-lyase [Raoultella ornithinolytica]